MTNINLLTDEQKQAFQEAKDVIDDEAEAVDADRATRGRSAGEVTNGEAIRVLAEAYLGRLEYDE